MPSTETKVLLVEDTRSLAMMYLEYLRDEPFSLLHAADGATAKALIEQHMPAVILLDMHLPDMDGQEILRWLQAEQYPCSTICITAYGSATLAEEVIELGARDYIEKPFSASRFKTTISNALTFNRLQFLVEDMQQLYERSGYHQFDGISQPMQALYRIIDSAATSNASIFITGESGTGKDICAHAFHQQGNRREQPFITLNCAAIPKSMLESEIFGHVKGAFSQATEARQGAARLADKGTLFLDEISQMDIELQSKLLRFVQTGCFQQVGSSEEEQVDVRFICSSTQPPLQEVKAGRLREDLYYRLHVVPVQLPPLRERKEDIARIARKFLNQFAQAEGKHFRDFSLEALDALERFDWPGNVRQLQNMIQQIVVLNSGEIVGTEHLPAPLDTLARDQHQATLGKGFRRHTPAAGPSQQLPPATIRPLAEVEREAIEQAIDYCQGNIPKAAALLDVSPSTLYRKRQQWRVQPRLKAPETSD